MMNVLLANLSQKDVLKATLLAFFVGGTTSIFVLTLQPTDSYTVWSIGNFLGNTGNDLFLLLSNLLILGWAWRRRLTSVIKLTLSLDLSVWILVQGLKLIHLGHWYLRPNGGAGGFPSGHAAHAFGMAFLLSLYFPRFSWLWYSCAAAISWSRLETEWHSGLQITAGIILGTFLVWGLVVRWLTHPDYEVIQSEPLHSPLAISQSYAAE
ncbi:MAG: superfamily protein [Firmicutes bacterium]|nr:superfamily protein [Bacillota bacterium]